MSGLLGSVSSIPTSPSDTGKGPQTLTRRGGEAEPSKRKRAQPYFCDDCGRRFYNLGWHAEACGSANYELIDGAQV